LLTHFDKAFARFVDAYIYISNDLAEHHIAQGEPEYKGIVIHNGLDLQAFTRTYDSTLIRSELSITSDEILVGLPGRISYWKGQDYFLEAIAEVTKQIPNLKGLIIGGLFDNSFGHDRRYFRKLQSLLKSLNLVDKILFTGLRSDMPRVLSALDVVVHASIVREPFGLVIIEGMAAGKPVIATGAGGVLDIIEDGVNGMLVPCKDSKAMAQAILHVISNKAKAKQMGLAARRHVANKFSVQRQVTAVQELYDSIMGIPRQ
jgi:glycosyltransferase involved in cell wall biosynthesis